MFFVLKGYAGTGKSFLMSRLRGMVSSSYVNIMFAAPTHKAANVLSKYLEEEVSTLASLLGVRASMDEENMDFKLPDKLPEIPLKTVVVIDEASAVSRSYLTFLYRLCTETRCRILFVGDPAQTNPVGERRSPVWKLVKDPRFCHTLTEVKRYDSSLLDLSVEIRNQLFSKSFKSPFRLKEFQLTDQITVCNTEFRFRKILQRDLESFKSGDARFIAWRNSVVNGYNEEIRGALGYTDKYNVGETFCLASPFMPIGEKDLLMGSTEDEITLDSIEESVFKEATCNVEIPVLNISFHGHVTSSARVPVGKRAEASVQGVLSLLASRAHHAAKNSRFQGRLAWQDFWKFKQSFLKLRPSTSLTSHRSQGSQFPTVYMHATDILSNPEKAESFRCLYVAETRAQNKLVVYG